VPVGSNCCWGLINLVRYGRSQFPHHLPACHLSKFVLRLLQSFVGAPSVLDVGTCSVPFNNVPQFVAQGHSAQQEPAVGPPRPPLARLLFKRLPCRKRCPPFFF